MDRRLLFPAAAMTALAQTTSPASAKAEKALRARAEEFYKLELNKSFRQAEAFVAEDSKDYFYNSGKPNFKDVTVGNIELTDNRTQAVVHINVKVELMAPGVGTQVFAAPSTSTWKLENGQWYWYFKEDNTMATPFGKMKFGDSKPGGSVMDVTNRPSVSSIQSLVAMDRESVTLTSGNPEQTVTISNHLPGAITLTLGGDRINGLATQLDKTELQADEKATLHLRRTGKVKPAGKVVISVSPLNIELAVEVKSE